MTAPKPTDEFVMVSDGAATEPETKIVMDIIGDEFIGTYIGMREISNDGGTFKQARFEKDGETYFMNANYSLKEGLRTVRNGTKTRIRYANDLDTGQASPMRVYTVEVARRNPTTRTSST